MNVTVYLDQRFLRTPDGLVWTEGACPYSFFCRYLAAFESVQVVARLRDITDITGSTSQLSRACGEAVSFRAVPHYIGPRQYLACAREVSVAARRAIGRDAVILRLPSQLAACVGRRLRKTDRPYGVEVVGDPQEVFAPGATRHPLRPLFRSWFRRRLRNMCAHAAAASYVTSTTLQNRYPPGPGAYVTHYSSAELREEAFALKPRAVPRRAAGPLRLITVASMESPYKGHDVLIDAVALCLRGNLDIRAVFVGGGRYRQCLERRVSRLGIGQRVTFRGQLRAGEAVRGELDQADLFVLPSRAEGLPRAMLEAMARGLPCVGSRVGGIPELLPPEDTVAPGDSEALAALIKDLSAHPARMASMAARNLTQSRRYHEDVLRKRRNAYYEYLRGKTEAWRTDSVHESGRA